jgi:phosphomannomutase
MRVDERVMVSVSGVRGRVGEGLTPELGCAFATALGTFADGGRVVLSRDGRPSGDMLRNAAVAGLVSAGCEVVDIGTAPTPTCGRAVRRLAAAGGLQITASHNPPEWNGLKLFGPDGAVLSADHGRTIKQMFEEERFRRVPWDRLGRVTTDDGSAAEHRDAVLKLVDVARVRARRFRVLLDANGGAGGALGQTLLEALGCEVVAVGCGMDGHFAHPAEPIPAHLTTVGPLVAGKKADVGFVLDPDADRLALIDAAGRCLSEELTLALAVKYRLRQQSGPVVVNMSTSRVNADVAATLGGSCERSAVGEANVVGRMRQLGAVIGGEGNGGVIDPRVGWVRDPFVGMAMILDLLAGEGRPLADSAGSLPFYAMVKQKFDVDRGRLGAVLEALAKHWPEAKVDRLDGLRLDWPDRWLHVRPSNTEPVVRAIAEAPTEADALELCAKAGRLLVGGA